MLGVRVEVSLGTCWAVLPGPLLSPGVWCPNLGHPGAGTTFLLPPFCCGVAAGSGFWPDSAC